MAEPKGGIGKEEWGITEIATQSRVFHLGDEDDSHGDSAQARFVYTSVHMMRRIVSRQLSRAIIISSLFSRDPPN